MEKVSEQPKINDFEVLSTLYNQTEFKKNDKEFMDVDMDNFENNLKILINEDEKIPDNEKIKMIKEILENSKNAEAKFRQILEDTLAIIKYCRFCKRGNFDDEGLYNPCWHKIDFVEIFKFAKFSKNYCDKDNYYDVVSQKFNNKDLSRLILKQCKLLYLFEVN
ncbi:892_t:CDS:2 [Dentiscutata erythropus]|uniref:892_t:CDS:1 n=1 Tax=Dentiscutata erythropus TaxID=1348616 RepID=A0A9N9D6V2_9GLOM|nr:892_t:CDS:2 [Dentiscutata erythropus]